MQNGVNIDQHLILVFDVFMCCYGIRLDWIDMCILQYFAEVLRMFNVSRRVDRFFPTQRIEDRAGWLVA